MKIQDVERITLTSTSMYFSINSSSSMDKNITYSNKETSINRRDLFFFSEKMFDIWSEQWMSLLIFYDLISITLLLSLVLRNSTQNINEEVTFFWNGYQTQIKWRHIESWHSFQVDKIHQQWPETQHKTY